MYSGILCKVPLEVVFGTKLLKSPNLSVGVSVPSNRYTFECGLRDPYGARYRQERGGLLCP